MVYGKGSYGAVVIYDVNNTEDKETHCDRIWGNPSTFNSYRSEAGGIATTILHNNIAPKKIVCDNEAVINKLRLKKPLHPMSAERG